MQLRMDFAEMPLEGVAAVWPELADEQRDAVVNTLARLIAATATAPAVTGTAPAQETDDE